MVLSPKTCLAAMAALAVSSAAAAQTAAPTPLPVDAETTAGGVAVACTGVGQTRLDSRWAAYGVRVEFSNALNEYLGGGAITVKDRKGAQVLSVSCDAPWILMKLPPGAYTIEGRPMDSPAKPRSAAFTAPKTGQMRLVLQFPDA